MRRGLICGGATHWAGRPTVALLVFLVLGTFVPDPAHAQALDLSHGGPVTVTAAGGIDWDQAAQTVTAHEDARATRGNVTVTADRLVAHYRKKAGGKPQAVPVSATTGGLPGQPDDTSGNEIYRLEAFGHVHIFTQTDQAWGDHAVYDIDQAVLVLTGGALKLTTPQDVMTARDAMEYWSQRHLAVGRGDATVTSNDGRRVRADTLVGYIKPDQPAAGGAPQAKAPPSGKTQDDLAASGKLEKVEGYGHVQVRTQTEIVTGDRGVYLPDTGLARLVGNVHITRGANQLNGNAAIVNMKTGLATLTQAPGDRVQGLIVPNESQTPAPGSAPAAKKPAHGGRS